MSIAIRKATLDDCSGIAKVHVDSWRTTYDLIVPAQYLKNLSYKKSEMGWMERFNKAHENYVMFVAVNENGNIVGFADGGPIRSQENYFDSEIYAIYILKDYQRMGIGKQLVKSVAHHLSSSYQSMLIWVLAENESRYFYEALGGKVIKTCKISIGGRELDEIAYGCQTYKVDFMRSIKQPNESNGWNDIQEKKNIVFKNVFPYKLLQQTGIIVRSFLDRENINERNFLHGRGKNGDLLSCNRCTF